MKPLTTRYEVVDPKSERVIHLLRDGWMVKEVLRGGELLLAFEPPAARCLGASKKLRFELKREHITLLKTWQLDVFVYEGGFTSLQSDDKRPFGNSSYIEKDIAQALGRSCDSDADARQLMILLSELPFAAQVVLQTESFQPGVYQRATTLSPWVPVFTTKESTCE